MQPLLVDGHLEMDLADSMDRLPIVELHKDAFPGFFLTSLGSKFLLRLYSAFIEQSDAICIVAKVGQRVVGFAAGTTDPDNFFRNTLRRHGIAFAFAAIPGLLRKPLFATRKCAGALFYRGEQPNNLSGAALLSSLAVSPDQAGNGVGKALVQVFCNEARKRGSNAIYLTTDEFDNEGVNAFYSSCGFELVDTLVRTGNRTMNRWVLTL